MNIVVPTVLLVLLAAGPVTAGEQDFILVNRTGVEIYELYIRPTGADDWQEDVLSVDTLPDGQEIEIDFAPDEEADYWNIRVVDGEGDGIDWPEVNLTEISTIVLSFEDGLPVARYE
jgi:hypothetical protein